MRRIKALMNSMHRRMRAVTDVQGGPLTLLSISSHRCSIGDKSGLRRPIKWVNVMIGEIILTNSGYMGLGVILLENRVYRCHGERFADACVLERDRFGVARLWSGEGYLMG
jgi:hypothetical protein